MLDQKDRDPRKTQNTLLRLNRQKLNPRMCQKLRHNPKMLIKRKSVGRKILILLPSTTMIILDLSVK